VIAGTPYILPYRIKNGEIQILAAFHSARQWPNEFDGIKNTEQ
jgi:toxin ParE1/3/4